MKLKYMSIILNLPRKELYTELLSTYLPVHC